jgi:hypothetical protein
VSKQNTEIAFYLILDGIIVASGYGYAKRSKGWKETSLKFKQEACHSNFLQREQR